MQMKIIFEYIFVYIFNLKNENPRYYGINKPLVSIEWE